MGIVEISGTHFTQTDETGLTVAITPEFKIHKTGYFPATIETPGRTRDSTPDPVSDSTTNWILPGGGSYNVTLVHGTVTVHGVEWAQDGAEIDLFWRTGSIVFKHASASATETRRISTSTAADVTVTAAAGGFARAKLIRIDGAWLLSA
jgi:hypothetical protein